MSTTIIPVGQKSKKCVPVPTFTVLGTDSLLTMGAMASAVNGRVAVPPIDSKAMIAAYNDTSAPAGQMAAAQALAYYLQQTHDEDLIYQMCCKHVPGWEAGKTEKTSFNLLSGSLNTSSIHEVEVNPVSTLLPDAPECVVFSILIVQGSPNLGMNWWPKAGVPL